MGILVETWPRPPEPILGLHYEAPEDADLELATNRLPIDECVDSMIHLLEE